MRWYLPSTSFIGYFRRYSPCPCSRSAAPLAQCEPRLSGESNTGSWRTQTPFSTTASTAQPTEQWPQTVRRTTGADGVAAGSAAAAFLTSVSCEPARPTPTPMPERRRNARRSIVGTTRPRPRARLATSAEGADASPWDGILRVSNMIVLRGSAARGFVVAPDVVGEPVAFGGLSTVRGVLGLRLGLALARQCDGGERGRCGNAGTDRDDATASPALRLQVGIGGRRGVRGGCDER